MVATGSRLGLSFVLDEEMGWFRRERESKICRWFNQWEGKEKRNNEGNQSTDGLIRENPSPGIAPRIWYHFPTAMITYSRFCSKGVGTLQERNSVCLVGKGGRTSIRGLSGMQHPQDVELADALLSLCSMWSARPVNFWTTLVEDSRNGLYGHGE